ncbi:MAG TPA: hypothetical protein VHB20_00210, partial [Verrucomicrobiae bacterium]|nr:hypothetical protein [Verrucomicrobiae bacterium]
YSLHMGATAVRFNPSRAADLQNLIARLAPALENSNTISKQNRRGLAEIRRLAEAALAAPTSVARDEKVLSLLEVTLAIDNLDRPTIPRHFDGFMTPVALLQFHRPIGIGEKPAANLQPGPSPDLSRHDPEPSTFWRRPARIADENLAIGFDRPALPDFTNTVCHYAAPKESSGMNPGFEVDCGGARVKWKFGEVSSEPLAARIFWALGFHADPTDFVDGLKIAYDRRIFTQFNSRRPVSTKFTALWVIPVGSMNLQRFHDPFACVKSAELRNGARWSGAELKQHLLQGTNFLPEVEAQIDHLVMVPANVQVKEARGKSIGPWDYGQLDHADLRELRGAGLLAAWLGFFDTRFDNTKLRLAGPKSNPRLEHYFSDLGGGLGRTTGLISWHGEDVNAFPWTFTAPPLDQGKGHLARPLRIVGYTPVVRTAAFAAMTIDDARWMARLIGQLTESQITAALVASGYDAPTVSLYTRKLISRRDRMMKDLRVEP